MRRKNVKVETTTDLRRMLIETIDGVRSGKVDPKQAHAISGLSGRVLQSAKLDLEFLRFQREEGKLGTTESKALRLVG